MTPEERELLKQTLKLSQENNVILKKMRTAARWAGVMRLIYWVLVIGISFGAYVYAKPYIDNLRQVYSGLDLNVGQINAIRDNIKNFGK